MLCEILLQIFKNRSLWTFPFTYIKGAISEMLRLNNKNSFHLVTSTAACAALIVLMAVYLFQRTASFAVWDQLAYFETAVLLCGGIFLFVAAVWLLFRNNVKYEAVFFWLVLSLGLLYMLIITPMAVPDEHFHYSNSYRIYNILMGMEHPETMIYQNDPDLLHHHNTVSGYTRLLEDFGGAMPEDAPFDSYTRLAAYPMCYAPQVLGIFIGRLLNRNFITLFELGRFFNLLTYAFFVYVAVKQIPRFKVLLGIISMTPMALQQAASFSTDSFINGLSFVLIAYACKMIWSEQPIERRDVIVSIATATFLAPTKVIYCGILLLYFLIPSGNFSDPKGKIKFLCAIVGVAGVLILLFQLSSILTLQNSSEAAKNWEGQENYNLAFVLSHPLETIQIFWNTLTELGEFWCYQAVGVRLCGMTLFISDSTIAAYILAIFAAVFDTFETNRQKVTWGLRIACLLATCAIVGLTMAAMFLGWTSNTRDLIAGVQGRYFIPAMPLVMIALSVPQIRIPDKVIRYLVIFAGALNIQVIAEVLRITMQAIIVW